MRICCCRVFVNAEGVRVAAGIAVCGAFGGVVNIVILIIVVVFIISIIGGNCVCRSNAPAVAERSSDRFIPIAATARRLPPMTVEDLTIRIFFIPIFFVVSNPVVKIVGKQFGVGRPFRSANAVAACIGAQIVIANEDALGDDARLYLAVARNTAGAG